MFATLILVLPSKFEGGAAHLSHGDLSAVYDCSARSLFETTALAWYNSNLNAGTAGVAATTYTCYAGNVNSLPPISQWMNYNAVRCLLWKLRQYEH